MKNNYLPANYSFRIDVLVGNSKHNYNNLTGCQK